MLSVNDAGVDQLMAATAVSLNGHAVVNGLAGAVHPCSLTRDARCRRALRAHGPDSGLPKPGRGIALASRRVAMSWKPS